jgi:PAS domain S-box-containing protein
MNKKTILIVDDTYENVYLLKVILEEEGYEVIEANDGSEGLKKLYENSNVDLIISDILMPIMDGYLFCQACQKEKLFAKIPFVFYTSTYTAQSDEDFALKLGASQFLRKPIDHDELLLTVNHIFDNEDAQVKQVKKARISEGEVLKLYSERLINKLEQKSLDLGHEVVERKKAEQLLIHKNEILDLIAVNTPLNKIFERLLLNYESIHPNYFGSICLLDEDGIHLNLESAPTIPKAYCLAVKRLAIGKNIGSCGRAAFIKKPVIVSDISTDKLWVNFKDIALKHNLKSCWSIPILSKSNEVLGTFAIYSKSINTPSLNEISELNFAVNLVNIAIEKSRIVAEIKKKDESYKSLIDQASDAIMTYSLGGTIHSFNKASYLSLGYTKKEFLKLKIQDLIVGDLIVNKDIHKLILKEKPVIFDRQLIRKDKSVITVEISAKLQKDGKILGIARDITEWQNNLKEIKKEKEFSSGLLKSMHEGLVVINLDSEIISVNPSFCEMVGFTEKELLGIKRPFPWSPPELRKENDKRYKSLMQDENKGDYENIYMHKNGKRFPVHVLISSIYDEKGVKTANFSTIQDITQRKKAEIDLKLAKEFTDKLIMSMQEGLLIVDLDAKILMVNDSLCNLLGYSKKELIGLNLPYPFAKTEDLEEMLEIKQKVAIGEAPFFKLEFIRKSGEKFWASFLAGNIKNDKGEVIALFGTIKDVSEEEKAKKLLIENAAKSNEKKNVILELAGLVGTDYKTALKKITTLSAETLNVSRVGVWKFNDAKNEIECEKLVDLKNENFESGGVLSEMHHPNYFEAIFKNKIISINDAVKDKVTESFSEKYLLPLGITSMLDVVIHVSNDLYGVLCFEHVGPKRAWNTEEEEFATSIANLVSLMVESTERKIAETKIVLANKELSNANVELNELRNQLERENVYLRNELDLVFNYEEMVYGSAKFSDVLSEVEKVAPTTATVLLLGESGTGKELLARAIHNTSSRNNKPLIKVNCSAIPRELIESELFGHKKGSFTGAFNDKIGKFELADGGTLFLDEIGEMPLDMQPKILRFLQEGEIEVVGGTTIKKLDVRVIAATNKNLQEEIKNKQFREDLFFRLNVFPIVVPPLRERQEDIPLLVEHFIDKFNKAYTKKIKHVSDAAMNELKLYRWPGNIRELENLIERAAILSNQELLIIPGFETSSKNTFQFNDKQDLSLKHAQRNHILQVLEQCSWKITGPNGASEILKLKPSTLRDKIAKLGLERPANK